METQKIQGHDDNSCEFSCKVSYHLLCQPQSGQDLALDKEDTKDGKVALDRIEGQDAAAQANVEEIVATMSQANTCF